jgi:protein-S-isoprenylcysteine O-methyltransferase Ste14
MNLKQLSKAGLAIAVLALITLVFRDAILAVGYVGLSVQVLAVLLMLWARMTFGRRSFHATADPTEGGLMTSGPYRYLRHPIYAAVMYFVWTGVISHFSLLNVLLGVAATVGLFMRILAEERLVTERYPGYAEYATQTKRLIPFVF